MSLQSLAALARQGFAWWTDELAGLLPPAWQTRISSGPRRLAERQPSGGWRFWRDGRLLAGDTPHSIGRGPVGLLLAPAEVLVREIIVPAMPAADVRRMVSLDIDRLSPLNPELIHHDLELGERDSVDGRRTVTLAVVPRAAAARALEAAAAAGLTLASLGVRQGEADEASSRFDFLPAALAAAGQPAASRAVAWLWGGVAALLVLNLAVLVGRDMADVADLRAAVDGQRPAVSAALRLRARVDSEERRRGELVAEGQRTEPLRMLNALTEATPPGAWVQRLEWNGQALRVTGYKSGDLDMAAAIRGSGAFSNPRSAGAEAAARALGGVPFDITADARPRPRP